jgi:ParB-like chromosome segregation protein Spo0J
VVTGQLHRVQRGHGKRFVQEPPPGPVHRPARVAVMLALAHKIQDAIDRGTVRDRAEVARRLGFTRARITHLLDLILLAPTIQEEILSLEAIDGVEPVSERALRAVAHAGRWSEQRVFWATVARQSGE